VTSFAQRPERNNEFAIGTSGGIAHHLSINAQGEWVVEKELPMIGGKIN
jgi:hypothetical protein